MSVRRGKADIAQELAKDHPGKLSEAVVLNHVFEIAFEHLC
jgi:hypothetical protein